MPPPLQDIIELSQYLNGATNLKHNKLCISATAFFLRILANQINYITILFRYIYKF